MTDHLDDRGMDLLFRSARTHNAWLDRPVSDEILSEVYELLKWAPTSANCSPARFVFLRTRSAKERLRPALAPGNVQKAMSAPVIAIVAYDLRFYERIPELFPRNPATREVFAGKPAVIEATAKRNSSLQGAYFILAARACGLDCGPMSGFDHAKVDEEFFGADPASAGDARLSRGGDLRSNFLCNIGYGDPLKLVARSPRLTFDEACVSL